MKFDKMYKILVNEGEEIEDTEELKNLDVESESDEVQIEDALELIGLNDADLTEIQKRALAKEAVKTKIYEKVKNGKLQPEDALDILLNLQEDQEGTPDIEDEIDDAVDSIADDTEEIKTPRSSGWEDVPQIRRGLRDYHREKEFMSGQDF